MESEFRFWWGSQKLEPKIRTTNQVHHHQYIAIAKRVWSGATIWPQKLIGTLNTAKTLWRNGSKMALSNPSDIFTKGMQDGSNFRRIRNSFMSRGSNFLRGIYNNNLHAHSKTLEIPNLTLSQTFVAQRAQYIPPSKPVILDVIILHTCFHLPSTISCLSSSGQNILSCIMSPLCRSLWAILWRGVV